jgi:hypothetical protein
MVAQLEDGNIHPDVSTWGQAQPDISGFDTVWPSQGDESEHSQHGDASDALSDTGNMPGLTERRISQLSGDTSSSECSDSGPPELKHNEDSSMDFLPLVLTEAVHERVHHCMAMSARTWTHNSGPRWAPSHDVWMILLRIKV